MINIMVNAQLEALPHGQLLLKNAHLTGALCNLVEIAEALEEPSSPPGTNRFAFASVIHERRESFKLRGRAWTREIGTNRARSPSPKRSPLKPDGKGGDPILDPTKHTPLPPVPRVDKDYMLAHVSAWISEPMRLDESENILPAQRG